MSTRSMPIDPAEVRVHDDPAHLGSEAAAWLCRVACESQGHVAICLSGGSTPRNLYECLAQEPLKSRFPWDRVHWFWGDERFVPPEHADSNYRMARDAMLHAVGVAETRIHAIPTVGLTPPEAAAAYAETLQAFYGATVLDPARPLFDVTLLGLGEDGHTASLFPGSPVLAERQAWAASVIGARPEPRITLTYPTLESSRHVVFLVSGSFKRDIVAAIRCGATVPAASLRPVGSLHWFVDAAVMGAKLRS